MSYTINVKGRLMDLESPVVMGILNVTPDSFYSGSRKQSEQEIADRVNAIINEGGEIIDVGAFSTRPGAKYVTEQEEMERLRYGLQIVYREQPDAVVSVDTFRPEVARMAVEEFGADIINDVSGGNINGAFGGADSAVTKDNDYPEMFRMAARLGTPYILMSTNSNIHDMLIWFAEKVQQLRDLGQKDIILDPGFGFGKTLEQNYDIMRDLDKLSVLELPVLSGISRKTMIYKLIGSTPETSLNGTTVLNTISLMARAKILRVHDVREAVETVKIFMKMKNEEKL